jgi:hypothetical protein
MSKRFFDHCPMTGVTEWYEETDTGFNLHYEQDCEPIVEANKAKQSSGRAYYAKDNEMWKVASIPITVQYQWLTKHGVDVMNRDHWHGVKRLLNDPEWRYLKTAEIII